jgi:nitrogen fixation NifU-like protein
VVTVYLKIELPDRIAAVSFEGQGCTISQAAASILSERVIGSTFAAIEAMTLEEMIDLLGREVVETRPRCATLALRTLKAAIATYRMGKTS